MIFFRQFCFLSQSQNTNTRATRVLYCKKKSYLNYNFYIGIYGYNFKIYTSSYVKTYTHTYVYHTRIQANSIAKTNIMYSSLYIFIIICIYFHLFL